jgi:stage V sporulation protein B
MVYPLYCILLTVSASGIPTGIARVISANGSGGAEKKAFYLYGLIGFIGSLLMFALSSLLAAAQGEPAVEACCKILSPAVFLVSILSVIRGYYQGKGNMYPTAITEVCEQLVKVCAGLFLAYIYRDDMVKAVQAVIFAVTFSEVIALCLALSIYIADARAVKPLYRERQTRVKEILKYTLPLTFTAIAMPLSQLVESIVIVSILRRVTDGATALYGVFSGCAITIVNLPVSVTYGLAAASVPKISPIAESGDIKGAKAQAKKCLLITFFISAPLALALYFLSPVAANIIFSGLTYEQKELLVTLVKIMAVNAVTLSLVQTSSACLTSLGHPLYGTISGWVTAILRVALSAILIKFTSLSVAGAAISANCCYLVAVIMNFCYIIRVKARKKANVA